MKKVKVKNSLVRFDKLEGKFKAYRITVECGRIGGDIFRHGWDKERFPLDVEGWWIPRKEVKKK